MDQRNETSKQQQQEEAQAPAAPGVARIGGAIGDQFGAAAPEVAPTSAEMRKGSPPEPSAEVTP